MFNLYCFSGQRHIHAHSSGESSECVSRYPYGANTCLYYNCSSGSSPAVVCVVVPPVHRPESQWGQGYSGEVVQGNLKRAYNRVRHFFLNFGFSHTNWCLIDSSSCKPSPASGLLGTYIYIFVKIPSAYASVWFPFVRYPLERSHIINIHTVDR